MKDNKFMAPEVDRIDIWEDIICSSGDITGEDIEIGDDETTAEEEAL